MIHNHREPFFNNYSLQSLMTDSNVSTYNHIYLPNYMYPIYHNLIHSIENTA